MGNTTLAQTRKNCIVTAYDVAKRKAVLFTSPEARKYEHKNYLLRDVARATSAAPTYFEMAEVLSMGGAASHLIDGAMYAGNPTMCAVVEANKSVYEACANPVINDLYIVSLGTGKEKKMYDYRKAKNWGAIGWARPVIDILLSASAEVVDYQMRQLFAVACCSDCYVRLEPELGKAKPDMDDASDENILQLKDAGECFINDHLEALNDIVNRLIENNK
jgi:patatin-like phospholipase/acyl hydrolase